MSKRQYKRLMAQKAMPVAQRTGAWRGHATCNPAYSKDSTTEPAPVHFYCVPENDWGRYPLINLNRYDCHTYFCTDTDGRLVRGFVFCRLGYHQRPSGDELKLFLEKYAKPAYEISQDEYNKARRDFCLK